MGIVVDSSVLIAAERQRLNIPAFHQANAGDTFHLAAIFASELLHGIERTEDRASIPLALSDASKPIACG